MATLVCPLAFPFHVGLNKSCRTLYSNDLFYFVGIRLGFRMANVRVLNVEIVNMSISRWKKLKLNCATESSEHYLYCFLFSLLVVEVVGLFPLKFLGELHRGIGRVLPKFEDICTCVLPKFEDICTCVWMNNWFATNNLLKKNQLMTKS